MSKKKRKNPENNPENGNDSVASSYGNSLQPSESIRDPFDLGDFEINEDIIDHTGTIGVEPPTEMSVTMEANGNGNGNGNGDDPSATMGFDSDEFDSKRFDAIHSFLPSDVSDSQSNSKSGSRITHAETEVVEGPRIPDGPGEMIPPVRDIQFPSTTASNKPDGIEPVFDDQDEYQVIDKLGSGGYGIVYEAKQVALDRSVAVKVLKPRKRKGSKSGGSGTGTGTGETKKRQGRFLHEAKITAQLQHPNIIPLYDFGVNPRGELFYSMKVVEKRPWSSIIRRPGQLLNENIAAGTETEKNKRDAIKRNIEIFSDVCDGMRYAHSQDIVHRDLKPENVMIGKYNEVLIIDFGMAIDLAEEKREFTAGGTLVYMAPEMARHYDKQKAIQYVARQTARRLGEETGSIFIDQINLQGLRVLAEGLVAESEDPAIVKLAEELLKLDKEEQELARQITTKSDIYLLGAMLYEIAVGHAPHYLPLKFCMEQANSEAAAKAVQSKHQLKLALQNKIQRYTNPTDPLRVSLRDIALKAMSTDPNDRYESVEDLQAAIRGFQQQIQGLEMTELGKSQVSQAKDRDDYQHLLPALESFRGAQELWPDPEAEKLQVDTACTYGNRAYTRKDFDAGLDILDEYVESKSDKNYLAVRQKLENGKRIRRRNRTLAAVGWIAAVVLPVIIGIFAENVRRVANREAAKAESKAEIAEVKAEIAQYNEQIAQYNGQIAQCDGQIAEYVGQTAQGKSQIAEVEAEIAEVKTQIADYDRQIANFETQLANIKTKAAEDEATRAERVAKMALKEADDAEKQASEFRFTADQNQYNTSILPIPLDLRQGNLASVARRLADLLGSTSKPYLKNGWLVKHYNRLANVSLARQLSSDDVSTVISYLSARNAKSSFVVAETNEGTSILETTNDKFSKVNWKLPEETTFVGGALSSDGQFLAIAGQGQEPVSIFRTNDGERISIEKTRASNRIQPNENEPSTLTELNIVGCRDLVFSTTSDNKLQLITIEEKSGVDGLKQRLQVVVRELRDDVFKLVNPEPVKINATTPDEQPLADSYVSNILASTSGSRIAVAFPGIGADGARVYRLETISLDADANVIEPRKNKLLDLLPSSLIVSNSDQVICGYADGRIRELGFQDLKEINPDKFENLNGSRILSLAFTPDGRLVSGSDNGIVIVWNKLADLGSNRKFNSPMGAAVNSISTKLVANKLRMVTGNDLGKVEYWEPDTNKQTAEARLDRNGTIEVATIDSNSGAGSAPALAIGNAAGDILYYGENDLLNAEGTKLNSDKTGTSYRFKIQSPFKSVGLSFDEFDALGIVQEKKDGLALDGTGQQYFFVLNKDGSFTHSEIVREGGETRVLDASREHQISKNVANEFVPLVTSNDKFQYFFTTNPKDISKLLVWQIADDKMTTRDLSLQDNASEKNKSGVRRIALSPDGKWLSVVRGQQFQFFVEMYRIENTETLESVSLDRVLRSQLYKVDEPAFIAFSPNSDQLVYHTHTTGVDRETWIEKIDLKGGRWSLSDRRDRIGRSKHGVVSWLYSSNDKQKFIGRTNRRYFVTYSDKEPPNVGNGSISEPVASNGENSIAGNSESKPSKKPMYSARGLRPIGNGDQYYVLSEDSLRIGDPFQKTDSESIDPSDIAWDKELTEYLNTDGKLAKFKNARGLRVFGKSLVVLDDNGFHLVNDQLDYEVKLSARKYPVSHLSLASKRVAAIHKDQKSCQFYDVGSEMPKLAGKIFGTEMVELSRDGNWAAALMDLDDKYVVQFFKFENGKFVKSGDGLAATSNTQFQWLERNKNGYLLVANQGDGQAIQWDFLNPVTAKTADPKLFADVVLPTSIQSTLKQFELAPFTCNYLTIDTSDGVAVWGVDRRFVEQDDAGNDVARLLNFDSSGLNDVKSITFSEIKQDDIDDVGTRMVILNSIGPSQEMSIYLIGNEIPDPEPVGGEAGDDAKVVTKTPRFKISKIEGALEDIDGREFLSAEFSGDGRTLLQVDDQGVTALLSK